MGITSENRFIDDGNSVLKGEKRALVLAGGVPQIRLINSLRRRGYSTGLIDYYDYPPARDYADVFFRESTLDIPVVRDITKTEKADILITCCTDQALSVVSCVSEELGLPCYIDAETGLNVTNKIRMKSIFAENGIPSASFSVVCEDEIIDSIPFPCIVKPADCNSSKGVIKATNVEERSAAIADAKAFSRTHSVVVEEYIEGKEISVDALVCNGKVTVLCVSRSDKIPENSSFVIERGFYSKSECSVLKERTERIAQQIVDAFHLESCPLLVQMLERNGELYVVEFSARTGGCTKYRMIELACGVDVINAMIDLTLGVEPVVELADGYPFVVNEFVYCKEGVFQKAVGFEECVENGLIEDYCILKSCGSAIRNPSSSGDRIAAVTFVANTEKEYINKRNEVARRVSVVDSDGNDIMRHDLFNAMGACSMSIEQDSPLRGE